MKQLEIIKWGRWRIAWASALNVDAVASLLNRGDIDGVGLSPYHEYGGDPAFLEKLPAFSGVVVAEANSSRWTEISRLPDLQFLSLGGSRSNGFDFRRFRSLVDLRIGWHKDDILPASFSLLKSLSLYGYAPKTRNLSCLPGFTALEELELVKARITSLEGVERFARIRELDVSYSRDLTSVKALVGTSIERVHFEACPKVMDIPMLNGCPCLKSIRLASSGNLPSLGFLRVSKTIEEFRFVKMEVLDGDMTPLLSLKSVGFSDRRGYSHTSAEIAELIAKRMGGAPS